MNLSSVLWSFIKIISNKDFIIYNRSPIYMFFQKMLETKQPVKIKISYLYNVTHYDFNMPDGIYIEDDTYIVFDDIQKMFQGIYIIYSYQEDSEYKLLIQNCYNKINEIVATKQQKLYTNTDVIDSLLFAFNSCKI